MGGSRRKKSTKEQNQASQEQSQSSISIGAEIADAYAKIASGQIGQVSQQVQQQEVEMPVTTMIGGLTLFSITKEENLELPVQEIAGVGKVTAAKLEEVGITKVKHLIMYSPTELSKLTGIDIDRCRDIIRRAKELVGYREFVTAFELEQKLTKCGKLKSHSKIDDLVGGGLRPMAIYELIGEFGAGKTQFCHQVSVTVQLPIEKGGLYGAVVYIDTEGTFSTSRIRQIASRFGLPPEEVLKNIVYARVLSTDQLEEVILQLPIISEKLKKECKRDVKLVVIDSFVAPFRAEYPGRENLPARAQKMSSILSKLLKFLWINGAVGVITNQIQSHPDIRTTTDTVEPGKRPWGGSVLAHSATYRIWLSKERKEGLRKARILDAPDLPEKEVEFRITDYGIE